MRDPLGRALTIGLALLLALSPLPFGAVGPRGRGFLEGGAFLLLVLWAARFLVRPPVLPNRRVLAGALGLLLLGAVQIVPLGSPPPAPADPEETALGPTPGARDTDQRYYGFLGIGLGHELGPLVMGLRFDLEAYPVRSHYDLASGEEIGSASRLKPAISLEIVLE